MNTSTVAVRNIAITFGAVLSLATWSTVGFAQGGAPAPGAQTVQSYPQGAGAEAFSGGYGMGPATMGGYSGYGMGPGMMYGYGRGPGRVHGYGMCPRMMYGLGYGAGPGWMPGYGMGPGMTCGYGMMRPGVMRSFGVLDLSDEQATKIEAVYASAQKDGWALGTKLLDARRTLIETLATEKPDRRAVVTAHKSLSNLRLQRLELSLDIRAKVDAVLTPKQREQLRAWRWGGFEPGR